MKTKIIALGDIPSFAQMEANVEAFYDTGFDGFVLAPLYNGSTQIYLNIWSSNVIPWASITPLWDGAAFIPAHALHYNFLRANVQPGSLDWFDPGMSGVTDNMVGLTKLARDSLTKGIFFDVEDYSGTVWNYSVQPNAGSFTFAQYKTQVYNFALALGQLMGAEMPAYNLFITLNYWVAVSYVGVPEDNPYGLLPSFLDGILDSMASFPCACLTIGNEFSFLCKSPDTACFENAVTESKEDPYKGSSSQFDAHAQIAMATYATSPNGATPFNNFNVSGNYFTPSGLTDTLELAAQYTDKYLWVYTGGYSWVIDGDPFALIKINSQYANSINNAKPNFP